MNNRNLEKQEKAISKGKLNYVVKHGMLGWGLPVALLVTIWNFIDERPVEWSSFIIQSLPNFIIYPIGGIFFGLIMFRSVKKSIKNK